MCDNHARNAKIIQFILRVNQLAFWYFVYPDTLVYLGFKIKVVERAGVAVKRLLKRESTVMKSLSKKEERLALWKHCNEKQSTMRCRNLK